MGTEAHGNREGTGAQKSEATTSSGKVETAALVWCNKRLKCRKTGQMAQMAEMILQHFETTTSFLQIMPAAFILARDPISVTT